MPQTTILPPETAATAAGIKPAGWWHEADDPSKVVCDLCPRGCSLAEGKRGFCFVRQNLGGQLVTTTYGRSTGFCIDPIEKKPLNHFYPGTSVLSFGTAGCNLGCKFCQNWESSKSRQVDDLGEQADPETVARAARELGCRSVAFTYNDPVVWAEYAIDCANACRAAGVKTVAVTAGYVAPTARKSLFEVMDAANVDLKGFSEEFYRDLTNSHLAPVQETLVWLARESNVWLEVTTLLIPGKNDSAEELKRMSAWLVETLGPNVPLHFTAFHPDFRMQDVPPTPLATLIRAHEIARSAGLKHVYTGNTSDPARQSTYCPGCGQMLIGRDGYHLSVYALKQNRCNRCGTEIAGRFGDGPGDWGPHRQPVRITAYAEAKSEQLPSPSERGRAPCTHGRGEGGSQPGAARSGDLGPIPPHPSLLPEGEGDHVRPRRTTPDDARPASIETFSLTPDQERLIFQAAGRRVMEAVLGHVPVPVERSLAKLAHIPVAGAFVSLKRAGQLRSCCGSLGQPAPLYQAIEHAAVAAAKEDRRFPPISPVELPYLEVDVWLLGTLQPVAAKGAVRRNAVVIGKHGLQISRGNRRGLLLPVVAVERQLDAEGFLDLVCHKAGLPVDAWLDDNAVLMTFQGHSIKGELKTLWEDPPQPSQVDEQMEKAFPRRVELDMDAKERHEVTALEATPGTAARRPGPGRADVALLADVCRKNVQALLTGATPAFYVPAAFDGGVQGIVLSLQLPGKADRIDCSQFNILGQIPLQSTLFELAKAAAGLLQRSGVTPAAIPAIAMDLTILWDAAMHGSPDAPQLRGLDPGQRALFVAQQNRWALVWNPQAAPEELLRDAVDRLRSPGAAHGSVFSLAVVSTADRIAIADLAKPRSGPDVRPPAVAGKFYPSRAEEIDRTLDKWFANKPLAEPWAAALVPHAGWVYSGRMAADVLSRVQIPKRVIVLAPKHRPEGAAWAIAPHRTWQLPGPCVDSDLELARLLADSIQGLEFDPAPHVQEHAIEVQLPLIARLSPGSRVVGITISTSELDALQRFGQQMAGVLARLDERPLLVISSDMNHFADDRETRRRDRMALDALASLDPQRLYRTVRDNGISMCGVSAAVIVLTALGSLNALNRCHEVGYTTSAAATGDLRRCVGYAGMLFG